MSDEQSNLPADDLFNFVRSVFPPELLVVAPQEVVQPLEISARSKAFLTKVGLPREMTFVGGSTLWFNLVEELPTLRELFPEFAARIDPGWDHCRFLSNAEFSGGYVISETQSGAVFGVSMDSGESDFVNTSVELFGLFLAKWYRFAHSGQQMSREQILKLVDELEADLIAADPPAMGGDAGLWPLVIEDLRLYA